MIERTKVAATNTVFIKKGANGSNFQQYKKYGKKLYDKNSTTENWQSAKKHKKYDKTFVYYRVDDNFKNMFCNFIF